MVRAPAKIAAGVIAAGAALMVMVFIVIAGAVVVSTGDAAPTPTTAPDDDNCSGVVNGVLDAPPASVASIYARYAGGTDPTPAVADATIEQRIVDTLHVARGAGFEGEYLIVLVSLAGRESGYRPDAYNGNRATGDDSYGLWQINTLTNSSVDLWSQYVKKFGWTTREALWVPANNALAARYLFDSYPTIPFHAWGPYRGDPPLHSGAENWVEPVFATAVKFGFIDSDGAALPPSAVSTTTLPGAGADSGSDAPAPSVGGGLSCTVANLVWHPLDGPDCDGLRGTGQMYLGVENGFHDLADFEQTRWGPLQPHAAATWGKLVEAAVADGFTERDLSGWSGGPGSRGTAGEASYSNHTIGMAIDLNVLAWRPTRSVPGEPGPVAYAFGPAPGESSVPLAYQHEADLYEWLRENAHEFGWCNTRALRPLYLNGSATGGCSADRSQCGVLEPWHWEFVGGVDYHQPPIVGDLNGPNGIPD